MKKQKKSATTLSPQDIIFMALIDLCGFSCALFSDKWDATDVEI